MHAREKQRGRERGLPMCSRAGLAARALRRQARDAGAWRETECKRGHLDTSVRPDVETLALPNCKRKKNKIQMATFKVNT